MATKTNEIIMGKLLYLVIHCTATPAGREVTSKEIRKWHTSPPPGGRGWKQVGYADMIHLNGQIENLVPYDEDDEVEANEVTNGAFGVNQKARHINYVGGTLNGKSADTRNLEQKTAMKEYCENIVRVHPNIKIGGHGQFNKTSCPGFDVPAWLRSIGIPEKNIYTGAVS